MAEYIEREALLELINEDCKYKNPTNEYTRGCNEVCDWAIKTIKNIPTADVVPKSEVNKLIYKLECFLCHATGGRLSKHTYDLRTMETVATDCINETYNDGYGEGYKDCAREIFEEIEPWLLDYRNNFISGLQFITFLAELKKKYTEGEE